MPNYIKNLIYCTCRHARGQHKHLNKRNKQIISYCSTCECSGFEVRGDK